MRVAFDSLGAQAASPAYRKAVDERVETPIVPIPPLTLRGIIDRVERVEHVEGGAPP